MSMFCTPGNGESTGTLDFYLLAHPKANPYDSSFYISFTICLFSFYAVALDLQFLHEL